MPRRFDCGRCHASIITFRRTGERGTCKSCGAEFIVPEGAAEVSAPEPPAVRAPVDVAARQSKAPILVTTTNTVQDRTILEYLGVVSGEAIIGANILRDLAASVTDVVGGRSGAYEEVFRDARHIAVEEMSDAARVLGANAVLAVSLDYESLREGNMIMVAASGTAVRCQEPDRGGAAGGAGG